MSDSTTVDTTRTLAVTEAPPFLLADTRGPAYLDFHGRQSDVAQALGLLPLAPGDASPGDRLLGKEVDGAPKSLLEAPRRKLPSQYRKNFPAPKMPGDMKEFVEEMLELHDDLTPAQTLLEILKRYPYLRIQGDAAALLVLRYDEIAEDLHREGRSVELWSNKVYPLLIFLITGLDAKRTTGIGPQILRAIEMYLEGAVRRAEVSQNYAGYFMQNIKDTTKTCVMYNKLNRYIAMGNFTTTLDYFNNDHELDLRMYTMLMQGVPDFFNKFPERLPQSKAEFLKDLRTKDAVYILHSSYVVQAPPATSTSKLQSDKEDLAMTVSPLIGEGTTALSRLKSLIDLVDGDDDMETILVPIWTVQDILTHSLDNESENVAEILQLLATSFAKPESKVRFVWPSESVTPLLSYRALNTSLGSNDDKVVTFAKWLDSALPPLSQEAIRDQEELIQAGEMSLLKAKLYGYRKSSLLHKILGARKLNPIARAKTAEVAESVQQGAILLCRDSSIQGHGRALGLWCEPQEQRRWKDWVNIKKETTWFRFHDSVDRTKTRRKTKLKKRKFAARKSFLAEKEGENNTKPKRVIKKANGPRSSYTRMKKGRSREMIATWSTRGNKGKREDDDEPTLGDF